MAPMNILRHLLVALAALLTLAQAHAFTPGAVALRSGSAPWSLAGSSAYLDFAHNRCAIAGNAVPCTSLLSVTRGSTKMCANSAGAFITVAVNIACITDLGLLPEQGSTNGIRNNSMVGAVVGSPGTLPTNWSINLGSLTQQIVSVGVEDGIPYFDIRLSGTTNSTQLVLSSETATQISALTGQTWTVSTFAKIVAGSTANITTLGVTGMVERTSGGAGVSFHDVFTPIATTGTLGNCRQALQLTLNGGATVAVIQPRSLTMNFNSGVAIDITLRIGAPQIEQSALATSPILTTTASATRSTDQIVPIGPAAAVFSLATPLTLFAEGTRRATPAAAAALFALTAGSSADRLLLTLNSAGAGVMAASVGGSQYLSVSTANSITDGAPFKLAAAFSNTDYAVAINGGTVAVSSAAGTPPVTNTGRIGDSGSGGSPYGGYISRMAIIKGRASNSQLQALTQ